MQDVQFRPLFHALVGSIFGLCLGLTLLQLTPSRLPTHEVLLRAAGLGGVLAWSMRAALFAVQRTLRRRRPRLPVRNSVGLMAVMLLVCSLFIWLALTLIPRLLLVATPTPAMSAMVFSSTLAVCGFLMATLIHARFVESSYEEARIEEQARMLAFQARFQPHTIFNCLNTIAALIPSSPALAEEATERLSAILRRILYACELERWTLREEFSLLGDMLRMETLRFGDRLTYSLELPEAHEQDCIPPLLLVPLVENALKHGFRPKVGPCRLAVRSEPDALIVQDDGVGFDPRAVEATGLTLTRQRLELVQGRLERLPGPGCTLKVSFVRTFSP